LLLVIALAVAALAASVYLVFVLEILKFKRLRMRQLQTLEPATSEHEIDTRVRQEFETGEFETVG
jgi:UDP-GlcNAc:undecaprenyl-phosphate GlcNAc-1-phosphate transferase